MFTLTLTFKTFADLHDATSKLATAAFNATIAHFDRPDVGAEPPAPAPAPVTTATFNPFAAAGGAVVPASPPVHSTAAVEASPIAPAASGAPPLPPVAPLPALPSAPAVAAPTAPVAPLSPAVGVQLDKAGLPWDARIHAKTMTMNADGTWRRFRGVQDALVVEVEASLRASMAATVSGAQAALAAMPAPPTGAALPPAAPPAPPAPPAAPVALPLGTFADLMAGLAPHIQTGKVSNLTITTVLGEFQLANLYQLATVKPEVVAAIGEKFRPYILAAASA